ncbi:RNA polymerase sigma factor [Planctomycetota bacterium]
MSIIAKKQDPAQLPGAGSSAKIHKLYEKYADPVYGYILAIVLDEQAAADIFHDVFMDCARMLGSFKGSFKSYLYAGARNRALTFLDKNLRREKLLRNAAGMLLEARSSGSGPEQALFQREDREILSRALAKLKPDSREILALKIDGNLSFKEIANLIYKPLGTVTWIYQQALKQLRRDYEQAQ